MGAADLPGMASWMRIQADEERLHALKFIDHVLDRGGRPQIGVIEAPAKSDGAVTWVFVSPWIGVELVVIAAFLALMGRTRVRADREHDLTLSAGWPFSTRIPISELTGAHVVDRVDPFGEFGGWGLRYLPGAVALVTRKGAGVEIGRAGNRRVLVTCYDPERLASVVNTLANERFAQPVR